MSWGLLAGFHSGLFALAFLMMLNGYLRGARKPLIALCVIVPVPILIGALFIASDWVSALVAVAIYWLVYCPISQVVAKALAFRILGYRTALDLAGLGTNERQPQSVGEWLRQSEARDRRRAIALGKVAQDPRVQRVLQQHGFSSIDFSEQIVFLKEQLTFLLLAGVDEEVAIDTLSRPQDLDQLLLCREQGETGFDVAVRLKCL